MTTKPALRLMIGDAELRAIGHVAAQWAYLETQMDYVLFTFMDQPCARESGISLGQAFSRRMKALRAAAKIVLKNNPMELSEILAMATDASSLRGFRDDIVHGHWKLYRKNGTGPITTGITVINQGPMLTASEKMFTAEKAEEVAAKISRVNVRLVDWCAKVIP